VLVIWLGSVAVLGGAALVLNGLSRPSVPASAPSPAATAIIAACGVDRAGTPADDLCRRIAEDAARRARLTPAQSQQLSTLAEHIRQLLSPWLTPEPTCHTNTAPVSGCAVAYLPGASELQRARNTLAAGGFPDVVTRAARPDDPAPAGQLLVAVATGPGCVIAVFFLDRGWQIRTDGVLPAGNCLGQ
jgi:hypothetical protein